MSGREAWDGYRNGMQKSASDGGGMAQAQQDSGRVCKWQQDSGRVQGRCMRVSA